MARYLRPISTGRNKSKAMPSPTEPHEEVLEEVKMEYGDFSSIPYVRRYGVGARNKATNVFFFNDLQIHLVIQNKKKQNMHKFFLMQNIFLLLLLYIPNFSRFLIINIHEHTIFIF